MIRKNLHQLFSRTFGIVCIVSILAPTWALAQEPAPTLQHLRDQIALMEKIENDTATTSEVRLLNRTLLATRKKQLAALIAKELDALLKYQKTVDPSLSANEREQIAALIGDLRHQMESLKNAEADTTTSVPAENKTASPSGPQTKKAGATEISPPRSIPATTSLSNHSSVSAVTTTGGPVSACYAGAPQQLADAAKAAAQLSVEDRDASSQFDDLVYFAIAHVLAVDTGHEDLLKSIEVKRLQEQTKRTDKQIGSPATAAGSTSAAEKPLFAEVLGFAIDHGAIQQSVNGTTLHLSTTPYALIGAFGSPNLQSLATVSNPQTNGVLSSYDTQSNYKKYGYLTRLGISADFNVENQDALLTNARRKQLADWSLRLRLTKDRSMRSTDAEEIWNDISAEFARPALVETQMLADTFQGDAQLEAKRREISARFNSLTADSTVVALRGDKTLSKDEKIGKVQEKILCLVKTDIVDQMRNPAGTFKISEESKNRIVRVTLPAYGSALKARAAALSTFEDQLEQLSNKPSLTFAYDDVRPANGANYSQLKVLFEKKTGGPMSLIANGGFSLYHKPNLLLKQQSVRDFSVALSFEGRAGRSPFLLESKDENPITYSFTGRYQRIFENRFVPGRKADIAVAQFKLSIPMMSGMSFPVSVTFANATELIKEKHVRANFGFSFDTDKLLKAISLSKLKSP